MLFAGQNIERSPFEVNVGMALGDANKVSARGPGLEPVGNVANKPTYFDIYTAGKDWPWAGRSGGPLPVGVDEGLGQGASQEVDGLRVRGLRQLCVFSVGLTAFVRGRGWHR